MYTLMLNAVECSKAIYSLFEFESNEFTVILIIALGDIQDDLRNL